jgi:hypothetical protein
MYPSEEKPSLSSARSEPNGGNPLVYLVTELIAALPLVLLVSLHFLRGEPFRLAYCGIWVGLVFSLLIGIAESLQPGQWWRPSRATGRASDVDPDAEA